MSSEEIEDMIKPKAENKNLFSQLVKCEKLIFNDDWISNYSSKFYTNRYARVKNEYKTYVETFMKKDLFLWCLLFGRFEIARLIWKQSSFS